MGMLKEFKEFSLRGNVVDMAVGIIIGGAFGKIVSSLVQDVIMPPVGMLLGNVDFSNLAIVLKEKTADATARAQLDELKRQSAARQAAAQGAAAKKTI